VARSAYPIASDLTAYLAAGGLTLDATQVGIAVLAGIEAFQRDAGRHMLAGKTVANVVVAAQTRTFPLPTDPYGYVDFKADLAAAPSLVAYQPYGGTEEPWTVSEHYILLPQNALLDGRPYTGMQSRAMGWRTGSGWDYGAVIEVTGPWGYGTGIPEDAWQAMLYGGVLHLIDMHVISEQGLSSVSAAGWSHEGHSESGGGASSSSSVRDRIAGWRGYYAAAVGRYRKVTVS
jgi:hypothetical protein